MNQYMCDRCHFTAVSETSLVGQGHRGCGGTYWAMADGETARKPLDPSGTGNVQHSPSPNATEEAALAAWMAKDEVRRQQTAVLQEQNANLRSQNSNLAMQLADRKVISDHIEATMHEQEAELSFCKREIARLDPRLARARWGKR